MEQQDQGNYSPRDTHLSRQTPHSCTTLSQRYKGPASSVSTLATWVTPPSKPKAWWEKKEEKCRHKNLCPGLSEMPTQL